MSHWSCNFLLQVQQKVAGTADLCCRGLGAWTVAGLPRQLATAMSGGWVVEA
jgi:hypothetical protein